MFSGLVQSDFRKDFFCELCPVGLGKYDTVDDYVIEYRDGMFWYIESRQLPYHLTCTILAQLTWIYSDNCIHQSELQCCLCLQFGKPPGTGRRLGVEFWKRYADAPRRVRDFFPQYSKNFHSRHLC